MKKEFGIIAKRALLILCAFVMTFTTVMTAGASEPAPSELSEKELYAIELLDAIGIYDGVDSIVGKEAFVRRDVMAFLAVRMMGLSDATFEGEPYFHDVDQNSFAYSAVNLLAQMNIIKGTGNGYFQPEKDITLDEATIMILRLMGYSQIIDSEGIGICSQLANNHGLHKGIVRSKDPRLQVKYLSLLLYNTLTSDSLPEIAYKSNGIEFQIKTGETLLSKTFDVYEIKGVITANGHTSVDIESNSGNGWVKIGNEEFQVGKTNADQYIGYYVTAYYQKDDVNTLLCINVESDNTVIMLDGSDVTYEDFKYTAYVNDKKKTYAVSRALNLIYNGKAIYYNKDKMVPEYGTITLINNNSDQSFDTVIVESVRNVVVSGYGSVSNIIQSKYDNRPIDLNDYDETACSIHKKDGKAYKPTSLKEWDILSVLESADGQYLDITVSTESLSGTVEKISNPNGKVILTIDGKEYEVAKTFYTNQNYDLELGYTGTFYLDIYGRIAASGGKADQLKWGYLIKAQRNTEALKNNLQLRILTQDANEIRELETAEKLFVDDVSYTKSNIGNLNLSEYQIVRYSLDNEGKIKKLYTAGNDFVQLAARNSRGFVSNVFVSNQAMDIAVDNDTVFLQVPNRAAGDDQSEDEFYGVKTLGSFTRDTWYTVTSYGFEEDEVVAACVLVERQTSTAATPSGTYMAVSAVETGLGKDDVVVDRIIGYDINKNKVEISARDTGVAANYGIEEGDFFVMVLYPDGTLQRGVQIYDFNTGAFNSNYKARDYNTTNFGRFGYAYDVDSNYLLLSDDSSALTGRKVLNASSATVLLVDSQAHSNKVKIGTLSDIKTYKRSGEAARIVIFGSNSVPRAIVCYQ